MTSVMPHALRIVVVDLGQLDDPEGAFAVARIHLGPGTAQRADRFGQKVAANKVGAASGITGGIFLEGPRLADDLVKIVQAWHVHAIRARWGKGNDSAEQPDDTEGGDAADDTGDAKPAPKDEP